MALSPKKPTNQPPVGQSAGDLAHITVRLDQPLLLTARGEWIQENSVFSNEKVAALFSRSVVFDANSDTWLVRIGNQQTQFSFEDTPIFVIDLDAQGCALLSSVNVPPIPAGTFVIEVSAGNAWYVSHASLPGKIRARLMPALQQNLSGKLSERSGDYVIDQFDPPIKVRYER